MPDFLGAFGAALGANLLKIVLASVAAAALLGGGFVWGDNHATAIALKSAAGDAETRVAAAQKQDQAVIAAYQSQVSVQKARSDALAASLRQSQTQLAAATDAARKALSDDMPENPVCDLPVAAVAVLRAQPARQ